MSAPITDQSAYWLPESDFPALQERGRHQDRDLRQEDSEEFAPPQYAPQYPEHLPAVIYEAPKLKRLGEGYFLAVSCVVARSQVNAH